MSQFTWLHQAVPTFPSLRGLLVGGIVLAATVAFGVTVAVSALPAGANDPAPTEPPVAATEPDTDSQDAASPVAPTRTDSTPDGDETADAGPDKVQDSTMEAEPAAVTTPSATAVSSTGDSQLARVEAMADRLPFNWRAAGATFRIGCAPERPTCHWGLYTAQDRVIWLGPGAFESETRLFYVVAHETAHAWQYANDPYSRLDDMKDWRRTGADGLEAAADCLAQVWGATVTHYWDCPSEARQQMQRVFVSTQ